MKVIRLKPVPKAVIDSLTMDCNGLREVLRGWYKLTHEEVDRVMQKFSETPNSLEQIIITIYNQRIE